MKQTARIISTYSADAFGVCSALFELGGMVIMHDASGCNSTYTTHDEPRWYDMDSMIYISALTEMEAIMGDDEKLIGDIAAAAEELQPRFIAVAGTPIPAMTGFDFTAVAELIEERTGIPAFGFATTGMNTYVHGASMALEAVARRLVKRDVKKTEGLSVNILGLTPLDFSISGSDRSLVRFLEEEGFEVISKWSMGCTLEELAEAGRARVNLVVSSTGLGAAKALNEIFGTPYVAGVPFGEVMQDVVTHQLLDACGFRVEVEAYGPDDEYELCDYAVSLGDALYDEYDDLFSDADIDSDVRIGISSFDVKMENNDFEKDADTYMVKTWIDESQAKTGEIVLKTSDMEGCDIAIIGEGIVSLGLAQAIERNFGRSTKVLCATELDKKYLREKDVLTQYEEDVIEAVEGVQYVIADPLYKPICPEGAKFIPLPAESFSGRIWRNEIPDLIQGFEDYFYTYF